MRLPAASANGTKRESSNVAVSTDRLFAAVVRGDITLKRCRIAEMAKQKLSDLHFDSHTVTIRRVKGSYTSQPHFVSDLCGFSEETVLRDYLEERKQSIGADASDWLFLSQKMNGEEARQLTTTQIYRLFVAIAQKAGIPEQRQHPHVIRHTMGINLRKHGARLEDIQKVLGHVSISSTAVYSKSSQEEADKRVDEMFKRLNHRKL
jgi:site-specific recombinase XerD